MYSSTGNGKRSETEVSGPVGTDNIPGPGDDSEDTARHHKHSGVVDTTNALGEVIATALVTAAVVTFAQTLVKKATDDTYAAARGWLHELFQNAKIKRVPPGKGPRELLIVRDPDPRLNLSLYMPSDVSDRAIQALEHLDLEAEIARARRRKVTKVGIYWDERTRIWRIDK
jgi:hypothetical protein